MIQTPSFILQLASALHKKLLGAELAVCICQNKDELMLGFALPHEDFWIAADFSPQVGMLYFPKEFFRAKKNSIDLFSEVIGYKVNKIVAHDQERSFTIYFQNSYGLMFKMHGRNANVLLIKGNIVEEIFKHNLANDWKFDLASLKYANNLSDQTHNDSIAEANEQAYQFKQTFYIAQLQDSVSKSIKKKIDRTQNYIQNTQKKLAEITEKSTFEKYGHILMANLHLKIMNQPMASFFDFYENIPIEIKLKPEQSLQKNAENYYRKAKNQKLEISNITQNIEAKSEYLLKLHTQVDFVLQTEDYKVLRQYIKENKLEPQTQQSAQKAALPFLEFDIEGFTVWVGKNAQNNDLLTLKYSHKEDLWLHAKDVAGSHVIIRHQSGKNYPKTVIEKAAQLAGYYSKRKNDTLAPITYTPRKYVRKPKGFLPGQVMVEREDVVLVQPQMLQ